MVGITLSPEQIRSAPPEVRRWLEQELASSLGLRASEPAAAAELNSPHLIACNIEEATQVLCLIQGMLPMVNVFFELGGEGESLAVQGLVAIRLVDIWRHSRLETLEQVAACLDGINEALRRVRGDADATLYEIDGRGYCFVAQETQRSIRRLWQQIVSKRSLEVEPSAEVPTPPIRRSLGPNFNSSAFQTTPNAEMTSVRESAPASIIERVGPIPIPVRGGA